MTWLASLGCTGVSVGAGLGVGVGAGGADAAGVPAAVGVDVAIGEAAGVAEGVATAFTCAPVWIGRPGATRAWLTPSSASGARRYCASCGSAGVGTGFATCAAGIGASFAGFGT